MVVEDIAGEQFLATAFAAYGTKYAMRSMLAAPACPLPCGNLRGATEFCRAGHVIFRRGVGAMNVRAVITNPS